MKTCPTCGHPVITAGPIKLSPMQRKLFEIVDAAGMRGIETRPLMEKLYDHDHTGGGQDALKSIAFQLNRRLAPRGLSITGKLYGRGVWRLIRREQGK